MSRIDQALRIWEETNGAQAKGGRDAEPADSTPLRRYRQEEEPNPGAPDEPAPPQPAEPAPARRSVTVKLRLPAPKVKRADAARQARLTTGSHSAVSLEQYRKLAAVLIEEQAHQDFKSVMITSALPDEGKTLTVVNLALTLSESYARRVLIIDADLRRPSVHTVLGIPNDRGLTEALRDDLREAPFTKVSDHLSALTAGQPSATPLAGLTSRRLEDLLESCATEFDWILIDTAPVGVLPDAQVLTRLVGGVLLVVAAGSTPAAAVDRAITELGGPEAIIGIVLNRIDENRIPEAGYYGRYDMSAVRDDVKDKN